MTRDKAYNILTKHLKNKNLISHCLATEACMTGVFKHLFPEGEEKEKERWGIAGLLHDADYETTKDTPQRHGLALFELENDVYFPEDVKYAIKAHNFEHTGIEPHSQMDWALIICDPITGLIVANALVTPEKKLSAVTKESVLKKYKQKAFARGVEREKIALCEEKLHIELPQFTEICLKSMQNISKDLGL